AQVLLLHIFVKMRTSRRVRNRRSQVAVVHNDRWRETMRISMTQLAVGVIVGGVAAWLWGDDLKRYATERSGDLRLKGVDTLHSGEDGADGVLDSAKSQVHATIQAGQEAIRPRVMRS